MTSSKRTFSFLILGTLLLLFYVHEQIAIFQVSYSIEKKERTVARLNEEYKIEKFRVARLRSPDVLNKRMKEASLDLTAPTDRQVIKIVKPQMIQEQTTKTTLPAPFQFQSWLNFIKEAQAKTSSKG